MSIILAFDSFKGCLSSKEIIALGTAAIRKIAPDTVVHGLMLADGGEGTLDTLIEATQGEKKCQTIHNLMMDSVPAYFGLVKDTCVIECAQSVGIGYSNRKNVENLTSLGMGEQIIQALDLGFKKFAFALGGSGTNDVGIGMLSALGVIFLDCNGQCVKPLLKNMANIVKIDTSNIDSRLKQCDFKILSDVSNPLCGKNGATYIYGPQKGVEHDKLETLDQHILKFSLLCKNHFNKDCSQLKGAGAAGGLGYAFLQFLSASAISGIDYVLSMVNAETLIKNADVIFTGEGKSDIQTATGKVAVGVAKLAKKYNKPVLLISGALDDDAYDLHEYGIDYVSSIQDYPATLETVLNKETASTLLKHRIEETMRLLAIGKKL